MVIQSFAYLLMLFIAIQPLTEQEEESRVIGQWIGEITQEEGTYRSSYEMKLVLIQQPDGSVSGYSHVLVDDIYAVMNLEAKITAGFYAYIVDKDIIQERSYPGMEWCMKEMNLVLKVENGVEMLSGKWRGNTSFSDCEPGNVRLRRYIPRA